MIASFNSSSVRPLSLARRRSPRSCSVLPEVTRLATVTRLRSRFDSPDRSHTSPNKTSSVSSASFGAKSPTRRWAGVRLSSDTMNFLSVAVKTDERLGRGSAVAFVAAAAGSGHGPGGGPLVDHVDLARGEADFGGGEVLLNPLDLAGAGDGAQRSGTWPAATPTRPEPG